MKCGEHSGFQQFNIFEVVELLKFLKNDNSTTQQFR